jgi:hypothetical protein
VDHVASNEQRNAVRTFLTRKALSLIDEFGVRRIDDRPNLAGSDRLPQLVGQRFAFGHDLTHLADLIRQRHPGDKRLRSRVGVGNCGVETNRKPGR